MNRICTVFCLAVLNLAPGILYAQVQKPPARALSLRVLQERLMQYRTIRDCPEVLLKLGGLTKIRGYVLDELNEDLILLGEVDRRAPSLNTEDFVIALRNAWLKYAELEGNTLVYSDPGCSIDPNPDVFGQLQRIGDRIFSSSTSEEIEKRIDQWHTICKQQQTVRVLGIPFQTHFAKTMIDADYYMKRLVDGSVSLEIDGLTSLTDMALNRVRENVEKGKAVSVSPTCMNRFEFCPGENKYSYDNGIIMIERCPVVLLTEEQFLSGVHGLKGTGKPNPLAQRFARGFSEHYEEIAKVKPIYAELEGLFRFVALAKIMEDKKVARSVDLDFLLNKFPIVRVGVDPYLPGISNLKKFQHRRNYQNGYEIFQFWYPSCGGVGIHIVPQNYTRVIGPRLAKLRKSVLKLRPSPSVLAWDFVG